MSLTVSNQRKSPRCNNSKRAIIVACRPKANYKVWAEFHDGICGEVDLNHLVGKGVFEAWRDVAFFNKVFIDPITRTLCWDDDVEIDPYVLRRSIISVH